MSNDHPPPPPPGHPWDPPGRPQPTGPGRPQQVAPLAIVSLVLGVLAVPCCALFVLGVAAVVTGLVARRQIDAADGRLTGNGMAMGGVVLGAVSIMVSLVYWVLALTGVLDSSFYVGT